MVTTQDGHHYDKDDDRVMTEHAGVFPRFMRTVGRPWKSEFRGRRTRIDREYWTWRAAMTTPN